MLLLESPYSEEKRVAPNVSALNQEEQTGVDSPRRGRVRHPQRSTHAASKCPSCTLISSATSPSHRGRRLRHVQGRAQAACARGGQCTPPPKRQRARSNRARDLGSRRSPHRSINEGCCRAFWKIKSIAINVDVHLIVQPARGPPPPPSNAILPRQPGSPGTEGEARVCCIKDIAVNCAVREGTRCRWCCTAGDVKGEGACGWSGGSACDEGRKTSTREAVAVGGEAGRRAV